MRVALHFLGGPFKKPLILQPHKGRESVYCFGAAAAAATVLRGPSGFPVEKGSTHQPLSAVLLHCTHTQRAPPFRTQGVLRCGRRALLQQKLLQHGLLHDWLLQHRLLQHSTCLRLH